MSNDRHDPHSRPTEMPAAADPTDPAPPPPHDPAWRKNARAELARHHLPAIAAQSPKNAEVVAAILELFEHEELLERANEFFDLGELAAAAAFAESSSDAFGVDLYVTLTFSLEHAFAMQGPASLVAEVEGCLGEMLRDADPGKPCGATVRLREIRNPSNLGGPAHVG